MAEPRIPTFHLGAINTLTKKEDIISYLIKFFFANPGWTSSYHENEMLSFRFTNAKYGGNPRALADAMTQQFSTAFSRYFPDDIPNVEVMVGTIRENGSYDLEISVTDMVGLPIIPLSKFIINGDGSIDPFRNMGN